MKTLRLLLSLACLIPAIQARASDITPYLEASTVAVARIDLQQVDIPQTLKKINELSPDVMPPGLQTSVNLIGGGLVGSLKQTGVEHIYVMLSTLDIMQARVSLFVPTTDSANVAETLSAITGMLPDNLPYQVAQVSDGVLIAPPEIVERLRQRPAANRPDLEKALLEKPATITLAVGLRDDLRQSVANLLSDVPPGEVPIPFSPKQLAADIESVTIQVTAPKLLLSTSLNTIDATAAERTATVLQKYFDLIVPNTNIANIERADKTLALELNQEQLLAAILPLSQATSRSRASMQESNNLKQIAIAMHNFESAYRVLPPRMSVSEDGTPLLSWRVHLLPYLNEQALYDQFHLDEPWDSPHNIQLVEKIPWPYRSLEHNDLKLGHTCVVQPLSAGSLWGSNERKLLRFQDVHDSTSNTLAVVIAPKQNAVPWTKPEDLTIDPASPMESLFGDREQMLFALLDTSVQTLNRSETTAERIMAALTHQGGEALSLQK